MEGEDSQHSTTEKEAKRDTSGVSGFNSKCGRLNIIKGFFIAVTDGPVEVLLHPESSETHLWVGVPALSDDLGHRPEHLHQRSRGQRRQFELYTASAGTVCASACIKHVWRSDIHPFIWI